MNKNTQRMAVLAAGAMLLLPVLAQAQHHHGVKVRDIDRAIAITDIVSRVLFPTRVVLTPAPVVLTPAYPMVIQETRYYPLDPFPVEPPRIVVEPVYRAPVIVQPVYRAPVIVQPTYYPRPVYRPPLIVSPPSRGGHDRHHRHDYQTPRGGRDSGGRGGRDNGGRDNGGRGGRDSGGRRR